MKHVRTLATAAGVVIFATAIGYANPLAAADGQEVPASDPSPAAGENVVYAPRPTESTPIGAEPASAVDAAHPYAYVTGAFEAKKDAGVSFLISNPTTSTISVVIQLFTATTQVGSNFTVNVQGRNTLTAILFATSTGLHFAQLSSSRNDVTISYRHTDAASVTHFVDTGDVRGPIGAGSDFVAMSPFRVADTRAGTGTPYSGAPIPPGGTLSIDVTGVGGVPDIGVKAVAVNVTAVSPTASGWLTLYPTGTPLPVASNLNFVPGQVVPNFATVAVGSGGSINVFNSSGSTNVIVDIAGYYVG